jgi:hypothetical protein
MFCIEALEEKMLLLGNTTTIVWIWKLKLQPGNLGGLHINRPTSKKKGKKSYYVGLAGISYYYVPNTQRNEKECVRIQNIFKGTS